MTLKNFFSGKSGFGIRWKENMKRRSWTVLLCFLTMLLVLPVRQAMTLSVSQRKLIRDPNYYGYGRDPGEWMRETFLEMVTFDGVLIAAIFVFAVLFAVQGFSWINNSKKLDLYLSVPVSSTKRYRTIYLNGILIFAACYFVTLLLTLLIGALMGAASLKTLGCAFLAFLANLLFFAASYNLTLIAVMLTGNVLVTLPAALVLFFYEYVIRFLCDGLRSTFFRTYCPMDNVLGTIYTSPLHVWYSGISSAVACLEGYGVRYGEKFLTSLLIVGLQAVVYGALAFLLYRKRKAEAAGKAMAFALSKDPIKLLLMIPSTLFVGLWFRQLSDENDVFGLLGLLIGLLLGHGLIQIFYEFDVRSVLKKKWHILAAGAVCAAIYACFSLDLLGYDSYIPDPEEIRETAFCFRNDIYGFDIYSGLFEKDMYYAYREEYMMKHMASQEEAVKEAVCGLARLDRERGGDSREYRKGTAAAWIKYGLNDGKTVYRTILVDLEEAAEQMDAVFADSQFQDTRYQIRDPLFLEHADEIVISYTNGLEEMGYQGEQKELIGTFCRDLEKYSFRLMRDELPVGALRLKYHQPGDEEEDYYYWCYPVYEAFEDTIRLLKEQSAYVELQENGSFLEPEQVMGISVTCYNLDWQDVVYSSDGSRSVSYSGDRRVTESFADERDISLIVPALYPEALSDIAGSNLTGRLEDANYSAAVSFRPGVRFSQDVSFVLIPDKLPDFVKEKTKYTGNEE